MVKVLVVDDKYFVRLKIKTLLEKNDYVVIEAENGIEAVKVYESEKPELTLCDIIMPEMDGISALKKIREINPHANVVMITSLGEQSILMEALSCGAKEVLLKPFDDEKVMMIVKKYT